MKPSLFAHFSLPLPLVADSPLLTFFFELAAFKQISWMGWVGICCILPAIFLVTIACGVSDRPPQAPAGVFDKELRAFNSPTFGNAMVAVVNILFVSLQSLLDLPFLLLLEAVADLAFFSFPFRRASSQAYGGSPGYFSIIAEMKNPLDYNKAMFCAQGFAMVLYVTISVRSPPLWFFSFSTRRC